MLTAAEDGTSRLGDRDLLDRATSLNRILVTQDHDLLAITEERQANLQPFAGLILCRTSGVSTGKLLEHLEMSAKAMSQDEMASSILRIPL